MRLLLLAVASLTLAPSPARAQASGVLRDGAILRVWSSELSHPKLIVVLRAQTADSVILEQLKHPGQSLRVSRSSISRLELQVPSTRLQGARDGVLGGAVIGVPVGVALGLFAQSYGGEYYPQGADGPAVSPYFFTVPLGIGLGGVMGGLLRAAFPGPRWQRIFSDVSTR